MPHKRAKRSVREADRTSKGYNNAPSARDRDDTPKGAARIFNAMKVQAAFRAAGRKTSEDTGERGPRTPKQPNSTHTTHGKRKADGGDHADPKAGGKKRKGDDTEGAAQGAKGAVGKADKSKAGLPKIGENESLGDYNRRVEALLRPKVTAAIKSAEHARGQQVREALEAKEARKAKAQGKPVPAEAAAEDEDTAVKPNRPAVQFKEASQRRSLNDVVQAPPQLVHMRQAVKKDAGVGASGSAWGATGRTPLSAGQKRIMEAERERVVGLYREMKAKKEAEREAERSKKGGKK